jgi:hypothetical protein
VAVTAQEVIVCPGCGYYQPAKRFEEQHVIMGATRFMGGDHSIRWEKRPLTGEEREVVRGRLQAALRELEGTG